MPISPPLLPQSHHRPGNVLCGLFTKDAGFLLDHIPQIYADPELHPALFRQLSIASLQLLLGSYRAPHCIYYAIELGQEVVLRRVHQPATMLLHEIGDDLLAGFESLDAGGLVVLHEATVTGHASA